MRERQKKKKGRTWAEAARTVFYTIVRARRVLWLFFSPWTLPLVQLCVWVHDPLVEARCCVNAAPRPRQAMLLCCSSVVLSPLQQCISNAAYSQLSSVRTQAFATLPPRCARHIRWVTRLSRFWRARTGVGVWGVRKVTPRSRQAPLC